MKLPASLGPYKGEQILNAAHIIKAGQDLSLPAQGLTIAVMTAMGESALNNVAHGDVAGPDSRGLFQQRANGAWGSAADRMSPTIAATNFFKALLRSDGWQTLAPTIAAHQVQSNADPYHYERFWPDAVKVVSLLTANPSLLKQLPATGGEAPCGNGGVPLPGNGIGEKAYNAALTQLAVPYSWGGGGQAGPSLGFAQGAHTIGFDCSALMQYAYFQAGGKVLPRTSEAQMATLPRVPLSQLQAGDLIFFHNASHVGISDGHGGFVHAPDTGSVVAVVQSWQTNPYWAAGVDGAARPLA